MVNLHKVVTDNTWGTERTLIGTIKLQVVYSAIRTGCSRNTFLARMAYTDFGGTT